MGGRDKAHLTEQWALCILCIQSHKLHGNGENINGVQCLENQPNLSHSADFQTKGKKRKPKQSS